MHTFAMKHTHTAPRSTKRFVQQKIYRFAKLSILSLSSVDIALTKFYSCLSDFELTLHIV